VEPTRFQKEREAREQLTEKHISRSWEKELEGVETYCQIQETMETTRRQLVFLMERLTLLLLLLLLSSSSSSLVTGFLSSLVLLPLSQW
jgi:hypothetical protein